ncbi:MAG: nitroreductase family protein [Dehalococcoidia bacterium]
MEVMDAIKDRRSIRRFALRQVEEWKLDAALDAARWAPSSKNSQPWEFIIVRDRDVLERIADEAVYGKHIASAPLAVAFVTDPSKSAWHEIDGAIATQNFTLAAWSVGLGTCWTGTMNREKAKDILGIPPDKNLLTILPVGYPSEAGSTRREEVSALLHLERYGHREASS